MTSLHFSYSTNITEHYSSYNGTLEDLGDLVSTQINYSPFIFDGGYRKEINSNLNQCNIIMLDFDDGVSINYIKKHFKNITYLITTTKSHQKEKNGLICDRFRLIFPLEKCFDITIDEYKIMMNLLITRYGADKACKKIEYENNTKDTMPIFSTSSHLSNNYINNKSIKWEDLYKVVCSSDNIMYSAHTYLNNHRNKENAISGFNLLMLDFDEDATIKEVSEYFKDYSFLIATTKSHLKMKNNKISERFRLILKLNKTIYLNKNEYELFMKKIIKSLPFKADNACVDISRMFFSSI